MTVLFSVLASGAALALLWLVSTRRITFPLLFDAGLSLMVLGLIALADSVLMREAISAAGSGLVGGGVVMLLLSYARQTRKYNREHRYGTPREIDGREMHRVTGGKDS